MCIRLGRRRTLLRLFALLVQDGVYDAGCGGLLCQKVRRRRVLLQRPGGNLPDAHALYALGETAVLVKKQFDTAGTGEGQIVQMGGERGLVLRL